MKSERLSKRSISLVAVAVASLSALFVAAAWACTPSAQLSTVGVVTDRNRSVTVTGDAFNQGTPVEIRWGSSTGPAIANADGPSFSVDVAAPEGATKGIHYLVAIQHSADGRVIGKATNTVDVRSGPSATATGELSTAKTQGDLWSAFSSRDHAVASALAGSSDPARSSVPMALGAALIAVGACTLLTVAVAAARKTRRTESN